ncbi:MAG: flagellar hook-length control protein FliK, partial [Planctomycetota bacterium]
QMSTSQTKDTGSSISDNNSNPDFEQISSTNNTQLPVMEQSFASSQVPKTTDSVPTNDISASVAGQIEEHIHSSLRNGDQQITIRLYPPELGKVFVRFQEQDDQIIGLLEVSKTQTRYEIEQVLPQVIRDLQDSGVQVKRLEVVLTDQSEQQAYKDQSLPDGSFQPRSFSEGKHSDNRAVNDWLADDSGYAGLNEPQEVLITDNGINMLM